VTAPAKKAPGNRVKRTEEVQRERDRLIPRPALESGLAVVGPNDWLPIWHEVKAKPPVKVVGYALLKYADYWDGANIHPGGPLLAAMTDQTEKTVGKALARMRDWGLIWRYVEGSKHGRGALADEYRLTVPGDLVTRVPLTTAVVSLPDHPNDVPVIYPDHLNLVPVIGTEHPNDVPVIAAEHPNLATGTPEPRGQEHPNDVPPTFIRDLFTTPSSPGLPSPVADLEGAHAGDEPERGERCRYDKCRHPEILLSAGGEFHETCAIFAGVKAANLDRQEAALRAALAERANREALESSSPGGGHAA
jgi:hypothetical protein